MCGDFPNRCVSSEVALFDFLEDVTGLFPWKWIRRVDNGVKSLNIFSLSVFLFRCPRCSIALTVSPPPSPTPQLWRFPRRRRRRRWEHGNLTHPLVLLFLTLSVKEGRLGSYSFVNKFLTHAVRYIYFFCLAYWLFQHLQHMFLGCSFPTAFILWSTCSVHC